MTWIPIVIVLILGFVLGLGFGYYLRGQQADSTQQAIAQATEALRQTANQDRQLDAQELESKKALIDQQLARMTGDLRNVERLVTDLEKGRAEQFGQIGERLHEVSQKTAQLTQTTADLNKVLSSARIRGQWGERMAEDVLQLMGLQEGINYRKQATLGDGRPDFTFFLPNDLHDNMDVKFPWDNYRRFVEPNGENEQQSFRRAFLKDVRQRVKEISSRNYIHGETIDCVLLFIPNEHIYAFIHDVDGKLLEDAIKQKVVLCSPITLFAVLAVVRQAVTNFQLEKTADELLKLMGTFYKQWEEYTGHFDKVEKRLDTLQRDFHTLITTRQRALERPLAKIDSLRQARGLLVEDQSDATYTSDE
ncbi:MAG: DNA recombination protein RmuC [Chloroflexota bacterium]